MKEKDINKTCPAGQRTDAAEQFDTKCSEDEEQKKEEKSKIANFW